MGTINQPLADELIQMATADQAMRANVIEKGAEWDSSVDQANEEHLKEIVSRHGWPTIPLVGEQASNAAWLLVQHSPDLGFMESCLNLMKKLNQGQVKPANMAYLEDRVLMLNGKPQIYGTQFEGTGEGMHAYTLEDPEHVDERRAGVGLGSFAENEVRLKELYKVKS